MGIAISLIDPRNHFQAFHEFVALLTKHRTLTLEMARREISDKYAGQFFGAVWTFGHPLILTLVYVFMFRFIFSARAGVGGTVEMPLDYSAYLLSGLIPWLTFLDCMSKSTVAITNNANVVKQVVFPIEVLPVKGVIASLVTQSVLLGLLIGYVLVSYGSLPWTYLLLPLLMLLQLLAMIGVSYILAAVGSYFRDIKDFVQIFATVGMYIIPILYLPQSVPQTFRPLFQLNPFSHLVWCYQDALYFGRFEHPVSWLVLTVGSVMIFTTGYRVFRKLKTMFGNVL